MTLKWKIAQKLEINWWKRYLGSKSPKEYLTWKKSYWSNFLEKLSLEIPQNASVLDAGCGPAGIFTVFSQRDSFGTKKEVVALDPLLDQYESLPHFQKENYPNVRFITSPLESAELPEFDYVFCLNAINHVANLEKSMDKIAAAVRSGGTLILSIDAHNFQGLKHIFRLLPGDALHPHQYDLKEYEEMVLSRGFKIENSVLVKKEFIFDYWALVAVKS